MPIPGSILGVMFNTQGCAQMYTSVATFKVLVITQDASGQEVHTFTPSIDPSLSNLPCRRVPLRTDRVEDQKMESGGIQRLTGMFRLSFLNYVNQPDDLLLSWQVIVDGDTYQITSVESDGNKLTSRLMIGDIVPYNG